MFNRRFIYIQIYRGYFLLRFYGEPEERRYECSGLEHPRTLAGDFDSITQSMRQAFKEISTVQMWVIRPRILVHIVPDQEGGITPIELRAFREAVQDSMKASMILLMAGEKHGILSDEDLENLM